MQVADAARSNVHLSATSPGAAIADYTLQQKAGMHAIGFDSTESAFECAHARIVKSTMSFCLQAGLRAEEPLERRQHALSRMSNLASFNVWPCPGSYFRLLVLIPTYGFPLMSAAQYCQISCT